MIMKTSSFARLIVCLVFIWAFTSCSTYRKSPESTATSQRPGADIESILKLAQERAFSVTSDWAFPLGGNRINLIGNPNYIRFKNDSVEGFLPYFGTVHMLANYGGEGGISFHDIPKNYQVIPNKNGKEVKVNFDIESKSENFEINLILFRNNSASISVNSAYRNSISYTGTFQKAEKEGDKK